MKVASQTQQQLVIVDRPYFIWSLMLFAIVASASFLYFGGLQRLLSPEWSFQYLRTLVIVAILLASATTTVPTFLFLPATRVVFNRNAGKMTLHSNALLQKSEFPTELDHIVGVETQEFSDEKNTRYSVVVRVDLSLQMPSLRDTPGLDDPILPLTLGLPGKSKHAADAITQVINEWLQAGAPPSVSRPSPA